MPENNPTPDVYNPQLFEEVTGGQDLLQAILNSTRDAIIFLDTAGRVILANSGVRELLGPEAEEWLCLQNPLNGPRARAGKVEGIDPDLAALLDTIRSVREGSGQAVEVAADFYLGDRRRYVEGSTQAVVSACGQILGRVTILRDVTRQHELQRFRDEMTGVLIHNLQGPLVAVISSLEMLRDDHRLDSGETGELVRIALTSARRLFVRIGSLLRVGQLEDRQFLLNVQSVPLPCIVQPVLQDYRPAAAAGDVRLEAHLQANLPPVLVDQEIVERVFSNLLDNAIKYTPSGGTIQVRALPYTDDGQARVLCAVADTGCGIREGIRSGLFGKYQRGQPGQGRRTGSGIGLHYCRLAVEEHGGRIWVDSRPGEGSTFYFTLPVARDPQ